MKQTNNQRIYAAALQYKGVCEVSGPKSNKLIQSWIKQAASWLGDDVGNDDSRVAWCGCFRGIIGLETGTGVPAAHYRAKNWLAWGKVIDHRKPKLWLQGDTLIFSRPGGQHVTLFSTQTHDGTAWCLGGNQSNKVGIDKLDLSQLLGVRRAPDL